MAVFFCPCPHTLERVKKCGHHRGAARAGVRSLAGLIDVENGVKVRLRRVQETEDGGRTEGVSTQKTFPVDVVVGQGVW